jgi:predicted glycoside hydrolase/deacetylase ChbG (UPF0249 family)
VRELIVNADDFGQSFGINQGVIEAHEHGIVTSASLMVRWAAAPAAAAFAHTHPDLGVGLHVDLGEWACRNGEWIALSEVVASRDARAVRAEVFRQLEQFRRLMDREPTHIDSHQHVHRSEPTRSVLWELATELGVPLRDCTPGIHHCGAFYGQTGDGCPLPEGIEVEALLSLLHALPAGLTELSCHPGLDDDIDSMYRAERAAEVRTLCDPRVRAAIDEVGIRLRSFAPSSPAGGVAPATTIKPAPHSAVGGDRE